MNCQDPFKSAVNLAKRSFDCEFATLIFGAYLAENDDARRDYGVRRIIAFEVSDSIVLTVVFTDRVAANGEIARRVISARPSNRKERRSYAEGVERGKCDTR